MRAVYAFQALGSITTPPQFTQNGYVILLTINLQHLKESKQGIWLVIDLVMLFLLVLNLLIIIVDALFSTVIINDLVNNHTPGLFAILDGIHRNFLLIDLIFVSMFLTEFGIRWYHAVKKNLYDRWFFFPFIHWYDLIGCIPLGTTRILRFLRVISIIYRLHHYKIIDFTQTRVYQFLAFYYNVLLEELSDRVVANVITGIQEDLTKDSRFSDQFLSRILEPRHAALTTNWNQWVQHHACKMRSNKDTGTSQSIRQSVGQAFKTHADMQRIQSIPIIGSHISDHLEDSIADIVVDSVANILNELTLSTDSNALITSLRQANPHTDADLLALDKHLVDLIIDILEVIREQVTIKKWKAKLNDELP